MLELKVLVFKSAVVHGSVNRSTSRSIMLCKVSTLCKEGRLSEAQYFSPSKNRRRKISEESGSTYLNHKGWNDAMKAGPFVRKTKLSHMLGSLTEYFKVANCFWDDITVQSNQDPSSRFLVNGDIEKGLRGNFRLWLDWSFLCIIFFISPRRIAKVVAEDKKGGADGSKGRHFPSGRRRR